MSKTRSITPERIKRLFKKILTGEIFVVLFPAGSLWFLQKRYRSYMRKLGDKPLVLGNEYGGLGDHLLCSALPKLVYEKYGVHTEISTAAVFRSGEIRDFVWGLNPHVSFSDAKAKTFSIPNYKGCQNYNEILFKLLGVEGELFDVYYEPKNRSDVSEKIICDITFGPSGIYDGYDKQEFWEKVVAYLRNVKGTLALLDPVVGYADKRLMNFAKEHLALETISVHSIYELTDLICSAKGRIFLDSGAKSIAAAYKKPSIVLNTSNMGRASRFFHYKTNENITL